MSTTTTELVSYEDPGVITERVAVAGFLAGYTGNTRTSYTTDLRIFADWCRNNGLALLEVRRVHLELFARWMESEGRMRSTVARRLSTLASFYHYCARRRHHGPGSVGQRAPTEGRSRVAHPRVGPQRARRPARPGRSGHPTRSRAGHVAGHERAADLRSAQRRRRGPRHRTGPSHVADRAQGRQARHRPARTTNVPGVGPLSR